MKVSWAKIGMMMGCLAAGLLVSGCDSGGGSDTISVGAAAPNGSRLDDGSEVPAEATVKQFYNDGNPIEGMGIMCQGNSAKFISGDRTDCYVPEIVAAAGAFKIDKNGDGSLTATGKDFVSPASGLVWKFMGWTIVTENDAVVLTNPVVITPNNQHGTFRGYWNSYLAQ